VHGLKITNLATSFTTDIVVYGVESHIHAGHRDRDRLIPVSHSVGDDTDHEHTSHIADTGHNSLVIKELSSNSRPCGALLPRTTETPNGH